MTPAIADRDATVREARPPSRVTGDSPLPRHRAAAKTSAPGVWAAVTAFLVGMLYAAVSAYWGLGGTWLLNTIGGTLERAARAGTTSVRLLVWMAVVLKLTAALLGLIAVARNRWMHPHRRRFARRVAWTAAVILLVYGGLLTATGVVVQLDLVHPSPTANQTALRWHTYLWDPWFLFWGLLLTAALARSRSNTSTR